MIRHAQNLLLVLFMAMIFGKGVAVAAPIPQDIKKVVAFVYVKDATGKLQGKMGRF